jgi:tetratricopeptide (TPR) repeat protein
LDLSLGSLAKKHPVLFCLIIFLLFLLVSCDRDAFVHLEYAARFFELGMYEQAVIELKTANRFLKDEEYFQKSMYRELMWGVIYLKQGDQQKAVENFSIALDKAPEEIQLRLLLAALYAQQQDFGSALRLFQEKKYLAVSYGAEDYIAGLRAYYQGQHREAMRWLNAAGQKLEQEYIVFSANQQIVAEQLKFSIYALCGEAALQLQDYREAARYYALALKIDGQNQILEVKLKIAWLLHQLRHEPRNSGIYAGLGYYYDLLNLPDRAVYYYRQALSAAPNSAPAYLGLALSYKNKQDYLSARQYLEKALQHAQDKTLLASIYLELGQTYMPYADYDRALDYYARGLQLSPQDLSLKNESAHTVLLLKEKMLANDYELSLELAESYYQRLDYPGALRYYSAAEMLKKPSIPALLGKAKVYYAQEDYERAHSFYTAVLRLDEAAQEALIGLTDIYLSTERYTQAAKYLQRALEKDRGNILLRNKLAYVYFYSGRAQDAVKEWRYVLNNTNNQELAAVLQKIIEVIG